MTSNPEREFIRVGVRVKKEQGRDYMLGTSAEVYDVDTGKFLPTEKADIVIVSDNLIRVVATLYRSEVEMINEV